jgi:hypothetical protein
MRFFKTIYQNYSEDEMTAHLTYQLEFLQIFELEAYDDHAISIQLDTFSEEIKSNQAVMDFLTEVKERHNFKTTDDALFILFSWDNLHKLADLMVASL